ncbi:MAG: hypothetical protein V4484_14805 [Pseudomonadota bacterium]
MNTFLSAVLVSALMAALQGSACAKEVQVYWTDNPPLICQKNGELDCIAGLLIKNAAKAGGYSIKNIEIPWARALVSFNKSPNAIFAATGRNEFTERDFNWFFQVYSDKVYLFTLDAKVIKSDAEMASLQKVAIRRGSPFFDYLKKRGIVDKALATNDWHQAVGLVEMKRVDGMLLTNLIGTTNLVTLGKLNESRINRFEVGKMSWYVISAFDQPLSADLVEFQLLMEQEKSKPYFQEMLSGFNVQN